MISLNKEARQAILKAIEDRNNGWLSIYEFTRMILLACGKDEDVVKDESDTYPGDPFCDDPECSSCNGIGADGHHY